jgi:hypothetical protein
MDWIEPARERPFPRPRRALAPERALLPKPAELLALLLLAGMYLGAEAVLGRESYGFVNMTGPLVLAAILGYGAWQTVAREPANVWVALFWFRVSTAVYFGLGTYAIFLVNTPTRLYMEAYFRFSDDQVFKLNVIVAVSALVVLGSARLLMKSLIADKGRGKRREPARGGGTTRGLLPTGLAFLAVGLAIDYGFVVPYAMKWTDYTLPGSIMNLANLTPVGVFMITVSTLSSSGALLPAMLGVVLLQSLKALLLFEKTSLLKMLILFLLAFLWHRFTLRRGLAVAAILTAVYALSVPLVRYGRLEMARRYNDRNIATPAERLEILVSYLREGNVEEPGEEIQGAWSRISYVNQSALAISLYDAGWPGNTMANLPAVFIPRLLWPEKPIITKLGTDFNVLATGNEGSASSPGLFAEAYWNFGWLGIPIIMVPLGFIYGALSLYAAWVIRNGRWIYFPAVLLALIMGFRTDGVFVADVAGAGVILIAGHTLLLALERGIALLRPPPAGRRMLLRA